MIPALRTMTRPREPPETAFQTATGTRTALFLMDNLRRLPTGIPRSPDLAFANLDLEPQSQDWNSNQSVTPTRNRSVTYVLTRPSAVQDQNQDQNQNQNQDQNQYQNQNQDQNQNQNQN